MNTIRQNKNIIALDQYFTESNYRTYVNNHSTTVTEDLHYDVDTPKYTILGFAGNRAHNERIDYRFSHDNSGTFKYVRPYKGTLYNQQAIDECFGATFYPTFYKNFLFRKPNFFQVKDILTRWAQSISLAHTQEQIAKSMKNTSDWQRKNIKELFEKFTPCNWLAHLKRYVDYGVDQNHYKQKDWKLSIHGFAADYSIAELDYQPNTFCPTFKNEIGYQAIRVVFGEEFNNVFSNTDDLTPIHTFALARAYLELWYHAILHKESEQKEQAAQADDTILKSFVSNVAKDRAKGEKRIPLPTKHHNVVNDTPDDEDVDLGDLIKKIKNRNAERLEEKYGDIPVQDEIDGLGFNDLRWIEASNRIWIFKDRDFETKAEVIIGDNVKVEAGYKYGRPVVRINADNCPCCNYPDCDHEHGTIHEDKGSPELPPASVLKEEILKSVRDYETLPVQSEKVNLAISIHDLALKGYDDEGDDESNIDAVTQLVNTVITKDIRNGCKFSQFQFKNKDTTIAIEYWFVEAGHDVYMNRDRTRLVFIHR
jgi:hypothetical protein